MTDNSAPALPEGWSTFAPGGLDSFYDPTPPRQLIAGRGNPVNPASIYGSASPQGLIDNGFYNVTDFLRTQAGGADITPIFYNPQTGQWGVMSGRGMYSIQDQPHLTGIDANQSNLGGMLKEAWGNGFGMAMTPFIAGLGGGVSGGASDVGTDVYAGESMNAGTGTYGTVGGGATGAGGGMLSFDALGRQFGTNLLSSGGDVKGALKNTAVGAGIGAGAGLAADSINSAFAPTNTPTRFGNDVMFDADLEDQYLGDTMKRRGMLDSVDSLPLGPQMPDWYTPPTDPAASEAAVARAAETNGMADPAVMSRIFSGLDPNTVQTIGGIGAQKALEARSQGMLPSADSPIPGSALDATAQHQSLRQALGVEPYTAPSVEGATPTADTAPAPSPEVVNAQQLVTLSKLGSALSKLNAGRGQPEDAPQRQEGQTDAQYGQTLAEYAHVDPQVLADSGFTPGTPEYYQFVMEQLDSVISQITNGLDPDDASLSDKLRTKSREELDSLERALYVRGQLGTLMGSGKYTDPFTGLGEDVNTNGAQVNPSVAAYHRGLYRSAGDLARMSPTEARKHVGGMLDRSPDLFGMQGAHNARTLDEILSQQNMDPEDIKRRRGMFAQDPFANLGSMSERDLEATLASLLH